VPRGANLSTLASALGRRLLQSAAQAPAAAMQAAAAARQAAAAHAPGARPAEQRASRERRSGVAQALQGEPHGMPAALQRSCLACIQIVCHGLSR
jgi:hypothetical protein